MKTAHILARCVLCEVISYSHREVLERTYFGIEVKDYAGFHYQQVIIFAVPAAETEVSRKIEPSIVVIAALYTEVEVTCILLGKFNVYKVVEHVAAYLKHVILYICISHVGLQRERFEA